MNESDYNNLLKVIMDNKKFLAFVVIAFIGVFTLVSYVHELEQRPLAINYLSEHYYDTYLTQQEKQELMNRYHITENEINPNKLLGIE